MPSRAFSVRPVDVGVGPIDDFVTRSVLDVQSGIDTEVPNALEDRDLDGPEVTDPIPRAASCAGASP